MGWVIAFGMGKRPRKQNPARKVGHHDHSKEKHSQPKGLLSNPIGAERNGSAYAWVGAALIVLATVIVYLNSFNGVFVLDDNRQILENPRIKQLTPVSRWLAGRRPVVNFTLAMNYHFGGTNPWGYHFFNLIVHVLAGLTLSGIIRRTLLLERFGGKFVKSASWLAVTAALLWSVHPLQTQSVTYVVQRGESIMGLFYLLTLYCVIRGTTTTETSGAWSFLAVVCCGLGMGTKAVMVTAPFIVLVYDRIFVSQSFASVLRKRWWLYAGLAGTWMVLPAVGLGGVFTTEPGKQTTVGFAYKGITWWEYLLTQSEVILHYLRLSFWPVGQCLDYVWRPVRSLEEAALPGLGILALLGCTIMMLFMRPRLGFLGLCFFVILSPTSSFIPIKDLAFEHRMYLPLAAVVIGVVLAGHWAITYVCAHMKQSEASRWISAAVVIVMSTSLAYMSFQRNKIYYSLEAMWRDVLMAAPENPRAHLGYGRALNQKGKTEEALFHYRKSVEFSDGYAKAHTNLGSVLTKLEHYDEAKEQLLKAIKLKPNLLEAHVNLASVYIKTSEFDKAIVEFRKALEINPNWAPGHSRLGFILGKLNQREAAMREFNEAIRIDPDLVEAHYGMGLAFLESGKLDQAAQKFQTVLKIEPQNEKARRKLEMLKKAGRNRSKP